MEMKDHLRILFFCLFVVNIGFGVVLPVLPFYTERLALAEGISPDLVSIHVGLLTGIYAFMQLVFAPLWGRWSDRLGRKPLLLFGISGYALAQLMFGVSSTLWLLYSARIVGGVLSSAVIPAAAAYVSDKTDEKERNRGMAWLGTAMSLGVVVGPALGGLLTKRDWHFGAKFGHFVVDGFSTPFFVAAALALLALLIATKLLPESLVPRKIREQKRSSKMVWRDIESKLRPLLVLAFIGQLGLALFEATFALLASARFNYGPAEVGVIFVVCGSIMAVFQAAVVGYVTIRIREIYQIAAGFVFMGLSLAFLASIQDSTLVYLFVGTMAFGMALIIPNLSALISKRIHKNNTGAAFGLQSVANNLGQTGGPILGGFLFAWSIGIPFLLAGTLLFSTGVIVIWQTVFAQMTTLKE
ncbi:MAG: MFS transporter [Aridibacter famidurans]|nr:MFS transporter [Aridibacter famidurans]